MQIKTSLESIVPQPWAAADRERLAVLANDRGEGSRAMPGLHLRVQVDRAVAEGVGVTRSQRSSVHRDYLHSPKSNYANQ